MEPGATLSRIVRFYGIDPERVMEIPTYLLDELISNLPYVEASETRNAAVVALLSNMKDDSRKSFLRDLDKLINKMISKPDPTEMMQMSQKEYDPQKAKEWFEAMGAFVISG